MASLRNNSVISCNKTQHGLCHACQLGKHVRLQFARSVSVSRAPFELVHCDLWTSPLSSNSGYKYYLVIVDDFSHYYWVFPLRQKSCVNEMIIYFFSYVHTQFSASIRVIQTHNGTEFVNTKLNNLYLTNGVRVRLS